MASREWMGRGQGRWQKRPKSKKRQNNKPYAQRNDLVPADHPDGAIWRLFPQVTIETSYEFNKEDIRKLCGPYGEIVGSRKYVENDHQSNRNYQELQKNRREWGSNRIRNDRIQRGAEIIATYKFTYCTDEAASNCAQALHGHTLEGYRISAWFQYGEKRCCPRPSSGRNSPASPHNRKSDSTFLNASSELDATSFDHQNNTESMDGDPGNTSTTIGSVQDVFTAESFEKYESNKPTNKLAGYEIEKCISSNEAINILDGIEIVTPGHFKMLGHSEKIHTSKLGGNGKECRNYEDVVINIEDCVSFSNENNLENQESIRNKYSVANDISCKNTSADDVAIPIEMPDLEFNSLLEFLQTSPVLKDVTVVDNEKSDQIIPTKKSSSTKKKKKKKQDKKEKCNSEQGKKEKFNSEQGRKEDLKNEISSLPNRGYLKTERSFLSNKGNWRCEDPSCNSSNSCYDELCTRCKLPCPEAMKEKIEKTDESSNYNKYYLAYAKSCVEIYVQDYTQHRDASKMTDILNKRFENGHKPPDKIKKDGVFAVMTTKGWVRGRVVGLCNGTNCSLQYNKSTNFDAITKQEENKGIENNGHLDCALLYSSYISHESNYRYNVNEEYYEKKVKIPYMEVTSSVLEHQIMIEEEYINATIIQKYLDSIDHLYDKYQDDYVKALQYIELTTSVFEHLIMVEENYKNEIIIHKYLNSIDNIHGESQEKNVETPKNIEFPSSFLEHQLMVEEEYEYETIIKKYLYSLLPENANKNIVPSLKYLGNRKLEENRLSYNKEIKEVKNDERYENEDISEVENFDLSQKQRNNVKIFSLDREISNDSDTFNESVQDEEINNRIYNVSHVIPLKLDFEAKDSEEVFNEDCKFCHVTLIDYGECICVATDNLGLLLREMIGISEMKTGPVYLENCVTIDQTEEKQEEGRKWLESVLENKYFQIKWNTANENYAEIFISDRLFNKEVCDRGYANPQGLLCRKCFKCGKIGHITRECPDNIKAITCYICGDYGHKKQNCNVLLNVKCDDYLKDTHRIENSQNVYSNNVYDRQSLNSTGNIMKKIRHRFPSDNCQICGNTDRMCNCDYDLKNTRRNYDCNSFDTYGNNRREMTDMMVAYDSFNMSRTQDRFINMNEYIPPHNYDWSPYPMMRSNSSVQSSVFAPVQNPYWVTPNDVYEASEMSATLLADANYHLSRKDGQVRALQHELDRIRTKGFPGLLDVMEKMKSLVNIDTSLAKKIGPDEPMERAIAFLNDCKEKMRPFMTPDGKINLDDFVSESKSAEEESKSLDVDEWLTPQEQLAAMKVHLEAVKGIWFKNSTIKRTRNLEKNLTYEDAIEHYFKWKVCYDKSYARAKTYYNSTITEWITFSNDAKNILDGAQDPKKPDGADIKKFYEQATKLEFLFKESEQIVENLPKVIITRINNIILQLEKFVLQLGTIEKSKKPEPHLSTNDESSPDITLAQYVQNTKESLPHSQVDRIVKDILEEVNTEHYGNNSFGCIHPQNILVTDKGVKLCRIQDLSVQMKIENWDFTAPEALQGKPCKASDIYSIGKIMMWLKFCKDKYTLSKQHLLLEAMPLVNEMIKQDPTERPSIQDVLSNEAFALPLHREADKKKNHVEKKNFLSKIDEEFVDEIHESSEENI